MTVASAKVRDPRSILIRWLLAWRGPIIRESNADGGRTLLKYARVLPVANIRSIIVGRKRWPRVRLKANEGEYRVALARHQRTEVYHWTPAARLPSVLEHGIICRRELLRRGIDFDPHSYGAWGKEADFAGHVCVSFYPHKGMMKQQTGPSAIIVMSSIVVAAEGAFYSPENTAKNEYDFAEISSHTGVEHLDGLFVGPTARDLVDWQAEVWIPNGVPVDKFSKVLFRTRDERDAALVACAPIAAGLPRDIHFVVGTWQFPSSPSGPSVSLGDVVSGDLDEH